MTIPLQDLPPETERVNRDFDEFAGSWSTAEADEFDKALLGARTIDPGELITRDAHFHEIPMLLIQPAQ